MLIGYARVSTKGQSFNSQIDALQAQGCKRIFQEVASGAKNTRPVLKQALKELRAGDVLVVVKLDRLGRSLVDLVNIITALQAREIEFRSIGDPIDTTSAQGKLIFNIFASLAQFERELISERTKAGLKAARARGRKGGRPRGLSEEAKGKAKAAAELYKQNNLTIAQICNSLGIAKGTFYRYLAHEGIQLQGIWR